MPSGSGDMSNLALLSRGKLTNSELMRRRCAHAGKEADALAHGARSMQTQSPHLRADFVSHLTAHVRVRDQRRLSCERLRAEEDHARSLVSHDMLAVICVSLLALPRWTGVLLCAEHFCGGQLDRDII